MDWSAELTNWTTCSFAVQSANRISDHYSRESNVVIEDGPKRWLAGRMEMDGWMDNY